MDTGAAVQIPTLEDIRDAQRRIAGAVRVTPVLTDPDFNRLLGCRLWLKCENLQRTGAFKFRGASNAVARLQENGIDGDVATHSSGNHGAALALAAASHGRRARVVMPEGSSPAKVDAVRRYGGEITFCQATQAARESGLAELVAAGCVPIPPYDHPDIICGQGTAALEFASEHDDLDVIMVPVGGGGLVSGTAIAAKALIDGISVIGVEPEGAAETALSMQLGQRITNFRVNTVADGLRAVIGTLNFRIVMQSVDDVLTVSDSGIIAAMALVWQHFRMLIEPSSATVIAALLSYPERFADLRVGVIVSGGNVDLESLPFDSRE
jgi:threonine dehydratase